MIRAFSSLIRPTATGLLRSTAPTPALRSSSSPLWSSSSSSLSTNLSRRFAHSFIDKAAHHGGRALVGAFPSYIGRFDEVLKKVTIDRMDPGDVQVTFEVEEACANGYGTLHGGFIATIVDVVGTLALISKDKDKAGVSLDLNVSYLNAAAIGERIVCVGRVLRMGNSYGFTEVELFRESDRKPIATGRHTKAFAPPKDHKKH